ncbi:hypothetical protein HKX48_008958, partial [Thoreauomyces humboldtii]
MSDYSGSAGYSPEWFPSDDDSILFGLLLDPPIFDSPPTLETSFEFPYAQQSNAPYVHQSHQQQLTQQFQREQAKLNGNFDPYGNPHHSHFPSPPQFDSTSNDFSPYSSSHVLHPGPIVAPSVDMFEKTLLPDAFGGAPTHREIALGFHDPTSTFTVPQFTPTDDHHGSVAWSNQMQPLLFQPAMQPDPVEAATSASATNPPYGALVGDADDPSLAKLLDDMEALLSPPMTDPGFVLQFPMDTSGDRVTSEAMPLPLPSVIVPSNTRPPPTMSQTTAYPSPITAQTTPAAMSARRVPSQSSSHQPPLASNQHPSAAATTTSAPISRQSSLELIFDPANGSTSTSTTKPKRAGSTNPTLEAPIRCKSCGTRISTLLTFNTTTSDFLSKHLALDVVCDACHQLSKTGSGALKRSARPDLPCHLCTRIIGNGGMVLKERAVKGGGNGGEASQKETVDGDGKGGGDGDGEDKEAVEKLVFDPFGYLKASSAHPLEWVCSACACDFQLCTACGGGGRYRSGKWRPKAMFPDGRKSCSLSHVRFKKEAEFTTYDLSTNEHLVDDTLTECARIHREFWFSQLMTPKVLSGKVVAGMAVIEKVIAEWWEGIERALSRPLPEGRMRFLAIAWRMEAKRNGQTEEQLARCAIGSGASMKARGWQVHGYHIMEWHEKARSVHLASATFWKLASDSPQIVIDAAVAGCWRMLFIASIRASKMPVPTDGSPPVDRRDMFPTHMWRCIRPTFNPQGDRLLRQQGWMTKQELTKYPLDATFLRQTEAAQSQPNPFGDLQAHATK